MASTAVRTGRHRLLTQQPNHGSNRHKSARGPEPRRAGGVSKRSPISVAATSAVDEIGRSTLTRSSSPPSPSSTARSASRCARPRSPSSARPPSPSASASSSSRSTTAAPPASSGPLPSSPAPPARATRSCRAGRRSTRRRGSGPTSRSPRHSLSEEIFCPWRALASTSQHTHISRPWAADFPIW